jgi:hypothetical protein
MWLYNQQYNIVCFANSGLKSYEVTWRELKLVDAVWLLLLSNLGVSLRLNHHTYCHPLPSQFVMVFLLSLSY